MRIPFDIEQSYQRLRVAAVFEDERLLEIVDAELEAELPVMAIAIPATNMPPIISTR